MRLEKIFTSTLILIIFFSISLFKIKAKHSEIPSFSIFNVKNESQVKIENLIDFYLEEKGYNLDSSGANTLRGRKNNSFWNKSK